jgi:hypothetical protein
LSIRDSGQNISFYVVGALDPHGMKMQVVKFGSESLKTFVSISGKVYVFRMGISGA